MAKIFEDDFDGSNSGEGTWHNIGGGGTIVSGGDPNNCIRFDGGNGYSRQTADHGNISVFFGFKVSDGFTTNAACIDIRNSIAGDFVGISLCQLKLEPDHSFSVYTGGTLVANTKESGYGDFSLEDNTWYFIQLNCELSDVTLLGVHYVGVKVGLAVNGKKLFENISKTSAILSSTVPDGVIAASLYYVTGTGNGPHYFDNIYIQDEVNLNVFPYPGAPSGRLTQAVLEAVQVPTDGSGRLSQGVIELQELPTTATVRLSQAVIEILLKGDFVIGARWHIYEA